LSRSLLQLSQSLTSVKQADSLVTADAAPMTGVLVQIDAVTLDKLV